MASVVIIAGYDFTEKLYTGRKQANNDHDYVDAPPRPGVIRFVVQEEKHRSGIRGVRRVR